MSEIDMDYMSAEGLRDSLREEAERLAKKYGVQSLAIFVTQMTSEAKTQSITARAGNYYATYGYVRQWIVQEDESERANTRRDAEE